MMKTNIVIVAQRGDEFPLVGEVYASKDGVYLLPTTGNEVPVVAKDTGTMESHLRKVGYQILRRMNNA